MFIAKRKMCVQYYFFKNKLVYDPKDLNICIWNSEKKKYQHVIQNLLSTKTQSSIGNIKLFLIHHSKHWIAIKLYAFILKGLFHRHTFLWKGGL